MTYKVGDTVTVTDENGGCDWAGIITSVSPGGPAVSYGGYSEIFHDGRRGTRYLTSQKLEATDD